MNSPSPGAKPVGAWVLFFALGLLMIVFGVYLAVLPSADPDHWRSYTTDPDVVAYLADDFRANGGMTVAFGVLTAVVSFRWFRAGDRWAWFAFWIFPILCVWGMATTWAIALWLLLLIVTTVALLVPYRRFFPPAGR
jgi:hypothetical protein